MDSTKEPLTGDQIRLRLEDAVRQVDRASPILFLLYDVLPDLVDENARLRAALREAERGHTG